MSRSTFIGADELPEIDIAVGDFKTSNTVSVISTAPPLPRFVSLIVIVSFLEKNNPSADTVILADPSEETTTDIIASCPLPLVVYLLLSIVYVPGTLDASASTVSVIEVIIPSGAQ